MASLEDDDRIVVGALRKHGLPVKSVYDLVNSRDDYPEAVPTLLRCLDEVTNLNIREGIIRALRVPSARTEVVSARLIREFESAPAQATLYKWAIGNTLEGIATPEIFPALARIALDPGHGAARELVLVALARMPHDDAYPVLLGLLDDGEVVLHAIIALGKLGVPQAIPRLKEFVNHDRKAVRDAAEKALRTLQKKKTSQ